MDETELSGNFDLFDVEHWADLLKGHDRTLRDIACLLRYERRTSDEITMIAKEAGDVEDRLIQRKEWFEEWGCSDLLKEQRWGE